MIDITSITSCRVCQKTGLVPFFDLGKQPPANSLLSSPDEYEKERAYPLSLSWCPHCCLVQLNETVNPELLFSRYLWVTATSDTANVFAHTFFNELAARTEDAQGEYVLEVGSNDGTFLKPFAEAGYRVLGVDPAQNIVDVANVAGVPTTCAFFGENVAKKLLQEHGTAKIIFARNVLPHVANTHDFVEGLRIAINANGVLAVEAHYAGTILRELHYDSIYHEHLCYFTLQSLENLLRLHGFFVFDIAQSPISGGSIILYARPGTGSMKEQLEDIADTERSERTALAAFRAKEMRAGVNTLEAWKDFARRAYEHRAKLVEILRGIDSKALVGWGASARSSTMLNFAGIGTDILPHIIDTNPLKQGKYTAGTHIPIVSAEEAMRRRPKIVFVLAWNFAEEIQQTLVQKFGFHGTCLVPLPNAPRMIDV